MTDLLRLERTGPGGVVARVTLTRPDVHNAFNASLIAELRSTFAGARAALAAVRAAGHADASELSMGMSGDYEIAVEEGATIVRLGTVLFGARAT